MILISIAAFLRQTAGSSTTIEKQTLIILPRRVDSRASRQHSVNDRLDAQSPHRGDEDVLLAAEALFMRVAIDISFGGRS